jgi:Outer membrane protein beta-barrel domain
MNVYPFPGLNAFARKLLMLIFILVCNEKTNAQAGVDTLFKRFGFQAGINISNMDFNAGEPAPAVHADAAWKTGFTFGFQLHIPIAQKLLLQPEYSFSQRNGSDKSQGIDYTINYFSMLILLNYQISPRFSLIAGPQFEITIDAKSSENGEENTITHDVEERGIGILAGIEVTIIKSLFLSARYLQGLNHVGIGQRSNLKEFKFQVVYLTAGIRF